MVAQRQTWRVYEALTWPTEAGDVDEANGIIRNVKVLGRKSRNNREYLESALDDAVQIYEGMMVNIDHPDLKKPGADRPFKSRLGQLRGVQKRPDGVYASLHYLKSNPLSGMVVEAARRMPAVCGFSHNATIKGYREPSGRVLVESIPAARSIDLVSNPATTNGIFESEGAMADEMTPMDAPAVAEAPKCSAKECLASAIKAALDDPELDGQAKAFMNDVMKLMDKYWGGEPEEEEGDGEESAGDSPRVSHRNGGGAAAPGSESTESGVGVQGRPRESRGRRLRRMELREEMRDLGLPVDADVVESLLGMPPANATRQLTYLKKHARARPGPKSFARGPSTPASVSGGVQESGAGGRSRPAPQSGAGDAPPWGDEKAMAEWLAKHS